MRQKAFLQNDFDNYSWYLKYINQTCKCQLQKMVKHTHTIRQQFADEFFEFFYHFAGLSFKV